MFARGSAGPLSPAAGRLCGVNRRPTILLAALATASVLSGCATFETDVVAKVGDAELTTDEFQAMAADQNGTDEAPVRVDGETARTIVANFIVTELLRSDLVALGIPIPESDQTGMTPSTALRNDYDLAVQSWTAMPAESFVDEQVVATYADAAKSLELVCVSQILVNSEESADAVLAELESGADYADVAAIYSIDINTSDAGGFVGCATPDQVETFLGFEFADALATAAVDEPFGPVVTPGGLAIGRIPPIDALSVDTLVQLRFSTLSDRYDVDVDPSVGEWSNADIAVLPLG